MKEQEENKIAAKYYEDELTAYERPKGDFNLLARASNRRNEVIIGGKDNDWDVYCSGYHRSAGALVRYLTQAELPTRRDYSSYWESMSYSIVFLYRHYLELRLKKLFITCGGKLEIINNEHKLLKLWQIFYKQYAAFCKEYNLDSESPSEESLEDIKTVEEIITQFNEIDEKSLNFRYPVDKTGKVTLAPMQFDLVHLKEMLGWAGQFLDAWSDGIYECWQAELRKRYEARSNSEP